MSSIFCKLCDVIIPSNHWRNELEVITDNTKRKPIKKKTVSLCGRCDLFLEKYYGENEK